MEITLAKALKLKNTLVREANSHLARFQKHNSYRIDNKPNFDATHEYTQYCLKLQRLMDLKTVIAKANIEIHKDIIAMAELKGFITQLRAVNTKQGKETLDSYGMKEPRDIEYAVVYTDKQIETFIQETEKRIEAHQDTIDAYNHKTKIEIPESK